MIRLSFPQPGPLLSMNDRWHWTKERRVAAEWRKAAWAATFTAPEGRLPPSMVRVHLPVKNRLRRDPHNYFKTVKPIIDGLVDGGLWPDDTPEYVTTIEPKLCPGAAAVVVVITPRAAQ